MIPENGRLHRWKVRWFGEKDVVEEQLRDIARQGSALAGWAHLCALLLIVLFSLGSLVALSGEALVYVVRDGWTPQSIPRAISVAVSTLLVVAMDMGMLYAAAMLRILMARRALAREMGLHIAVIVGAAILEGGTYVYMSWKYDAPSNGWGWALIAARALAAPLFSVYLSLARPLPVGPRDILYQVELATGKGVIRDAVEIANDASAPLAKKMALYGASAVMAPHDAARLTNMIAVMQEGQVATVVAEDFPPLPPAPPTQPRDRDEEARRGESVAEDFQPIPSIALLPGRTASTKQAAGKTPREDKRKQAAFAVIAANPTISPEELRQTLHCRWELADKWIREWRRKHGKSSLQAMQ